MPALTERSQNTTRSGAQPARAASQSQQQRASHRKLDEKAERIEDRDAISPIGKENAGAAMPNKDEEDITALPIKWRLDHSPHLRPVDSDREKAQILYDFQNATSQTSVPRADIESSSKSGTLKSKRSTFDGSNSVKRRRSSQKRKDEHIREEEIRAMSSTMPQPKRLGDAPLHQENSKRRSFIRNKPSAVSLPPAEKSTQSRGAPTAVVEQNGWDIHEFWYNPRPRVRLSKVPAYTWDSPSSPQLPLARHISQKVTEKMPRQEDSKRRHKTVGAAADTLDSYDLRMVLERDAKRKEERERRRQERLDRKLRAANRARSNSDLSRRDVVPAKEKDVEAGAPFVSSASQRPDASRAQSSIHPALRDDPHFDANDTVGLGIGASAATTHGTTTPAVENPFTSPHDPQTVQSSTGYGTPRETPGEGPFEDPVIETAREVRMSITATPPLSPVDRKRRSSGRIPSETLSPASPPFVSPPQSPTLPEAAAEPQPAVPVTSQVATPASSQGANRRVSTQSSKDRRSGAWASFFKRNSTQKDAKSPEMSFANTSRESMGRQHIPPHLIDGGRESPFPKRSRSGPPTRTQSKFREDLPDAPISPPESRVQSPVSDMPNNAAAIAAAAAASYVGTTSQTPEKQSHAAIAGASARSDTPVSPIQSPDVMAASLASVDSEASWLASGTSTKRGSVQSVPARSLGSFKRPKNDLNASYEDLGSTGDRDAEYVQRTAEARRSAHMQRPSGSAVAGASRDDEQGGAVDTALPVHGSVRRKPTLVHRNPAVRSREGLVSEFASSDPQGHESALQDDSTEESEFEGQEARLESARSVDYGKGHARQVSAGSAKLFDIASRRMSATPASPTTAAPSTPKPIAETD